LHRLDDDVRILRELREQRVACWGADDRQTRARADLALHHAIVAATHNPRYVKLYSSMLDVFAAHMREEQVEDEESAHRHHHDLVEAIADQDVPRATASVAAIFRPFMP